MSNKNRDTYRYFQPDNTRYTCDEEFYGLAFGRSEKPGTCFILFRCFVGCHRPEHSPWLKAPKAPWHRAIQIWAVSPGTAEAGNFVDVQWIGLRENLQETMVFTIKYRVFL